MILPDIAVCMIVKNEEHCIERCLNSIVGNVSKVCILDTGSTDYTLSILDYYSRAHIHTGWQIEKKPFTNFSEMRNHSIKMAGSSKWILILDADETIIKDSWIAIHRLLWDNLNPPKMVALPRHQWADLEMTNFTGPFPDYTHRLWQYNIGIYYQGKVHEQPCGAGLPGGIVYYDQAFIEHFNRVYRTSEKWDETNTLYRQLSGN